MKNTFIIIILLISSLIILKSANPVWWQNTKLKTAKYWSFATIHNNPILKKSDKDLSETDYKEKGKEPRINIDELFSGGPPKDGIPSIDNPKFVDISKSEFSDDELIIGIVHNNEQKAYPYAVLNWHEIVNDTIGGLPVSVTYCPLCETNSVFKREIDEETVEFGVSGKLYNSCLVMYDRKTDTLYSQPWGIGIIGEKTDHVLERIPAIRTTIGEFKKMYPNALSLTSETGHDRNYSAYPYGSYYTDENIIFPIKNKDLLEEHPKEITQIIFNPDEKTPKNKFSGENIFFTQKELKEKNRVEFNWNKEKAVAKWDEKLNTIVFTYKDGREIPNMAAFGFVVPSHFK